MPSHLTSRLLSAFLGLAVFLSTSIAVAEPQEGNAKPEVPTQPTGPSSESTPRPPEPQSNNDQPLPDSPGAGQSQTPNQGDTGRPVEVPPQTTPETKAKPVGTAVAKTSKTSGFAVAKPAGSAMAPAKQRRMRTIVISVAAVAGVALAVGTVAALSSATSSKPPGSH